MKSFKTLAFKDDEILTIFKVLSAILILSQVKTPQTTQNLAELFDLDKQTMDTFLDQLTHPQILNLCNEVYCQLFKSIVKKINSSLLKEPRNVAEISVLSDFKRGMQKELFANNHPKYLSIDFLDMLGFELNDSKDNTNGMYQLKNHYLNEKLQQFFIENVFKCEEIDFLQEGMLNESPNVNFIDNLNILQLFESPDNKNLGLLFTVPNKEQTAKDAQNNFIETLEDVVRRDKNNSIFVNKASISFVIFHSPKEIEYKCEYFSKLSEEKNNQMTYQLFEEEVLLCSKNAVFSHLLSKKPIIPHNNTPFSFPKSSEKLCQTLQNISHFDKYYLKCIVSSDKPQPNTNTTPFICSSVAQQLKFLNCENLLRFKKEGFLIKKGYKQFYQDYAKLANITINLKLREQSQDYRKISEFIIESVIPEFFSQRKKVLFGKNRIFLNPEAAYALDNKLMSLWKKQNEKAKLIQKNYQCFKFRNNLKMGTKGLKVLLKVIIRLQAKRKSNKQRNIFLSKKKAVAMIEDIEQRLAKKAGFNRFYRKIKDMVLKKKNVRFRENNHNEKPFKELHPTYTTPFIKGEQPPKVPLKKNLKESNNKSERDHSARKENERKKTIQIKNQLLRRHSSKSSDYLKNAGNAFFQRFMSENDGGSPDNSGKRRKCIAAKSFTDFENKSRNTALEEYIEISARKTFVPKDIRDFPSSPDLNFNLENLEKDMLVEIERNDFEKEMVKRFMKKYHKIMCFQNKALENPLLDFPKKYHKTCKKCFKYILQYSGDRKNQFTSYQQLCKLLKIMLSGDHDSIRDEVQTYLILY